MEPSHAIADLFEMAAEKEKKEMFEAEADGERCEDGGWMTRRSRWDVVRSSPSF